MTRNAVTNASGPSQELGVVIPHAEICGEAGNRRFSPDREYIPVGQCPAERKRLIVFLAIPAALLALAGRLVVDLAAGLAGATTGRR